MRESIQNQEHLRDGEFAGLCKDQPELALLAMNTYKRNELPAQLPKFTIGTLGYNPKHEDVLMKLVELDMCKEYPHLLHLACQCNFDRLAQMLIGRDFSVHTLDNFGCKPQYYADLNQKKFATSSAPEANVQRRQNEYILEYLATAKK